MKEGGKDSRFDAIRGDFFAAFFIWTISGGWMYLCMLPVIVIQYRANEYNNLQFSDLTLFDYIGCLLFIIGFIIEWIADSQKSTFKSNKKNHGKFINVGLWKISRHPNYFGEIILWCGIAIVACSVAKGWDWFMFVSPIWTISLLCTISGIPPSEAAGLKKYGHLNEYQEYLATTPVLIPFCGGTKKVSNNKNKSL